jgi:hypothetical protein
MNTANLQLQGLCVAVASLLQSLRAKGLLSTNEIDQLLEDAETAAADLDQSLRPANAEAVTFPIRFLRAVNAQPGANVPNFQDVARQVGIQLDRDRPGADEDEELAIAEATLRGRDA